MADKQFLIFCDESEASGRYFSNFYGGLLVGSSQYQRVTKKLNTLKKSLNLHGEVKWSKVTGPYLQKYEALVKCLFHELRQGHLKMRIMFRQNTHVATGLTDDQIEGPYFRLYYQFITHAFGFQHRVEGSSRASLRLFFDSFPATREEAQQFKGFIHGLGTKRAGVSSPDPAGAAIQRLHSRFGTVARISRGKCLSESGRHRRGEIARACAAPDARHCSGFGKFQAEQSAQRKAARFTAARQTYGSEGEALQAYPVRNSLTLPSFEHRHFNGNARRRTPTLGPCLQALAFHPE